MKQIFTVYFFGFEGFGGDQFFTNHTKCGNTFKS